MGEVVALVFIVAAVCVAPVGIWVETSQAVRWRTGCQNCPIRNSRHQPESAVPHTLTA